MIAAAQRNYNRRLVRSRYEAANTGSFTAIGRFITLLCMDEQRSSSSIREADGQPAAITSRDNRWLKRFRAALAGQPVDDAFVGVEGVRLVEAALGSGLIVEALLVS